MLTSTIVFLINFRGFMYITFDLITTVPLQLITLLACFDINLRNHLDKRGPT